MSNALRDVYRALESRYVHEGRTIDPSFYIDLSDDLVAKFKAIGFDCLLSLDEQICPRDRQDKVLPYGMILTRLFKNLKANMSQHPFDARKSKRTQLSTSSSTESPPSDNEDLPSTKLSTRSYHRALKDDPNMSKEQSETRGMFKNLGRALHNFAKLLKKGYC
ncbi:hypothetical protein Tco_1404917 [Tanacetum coccineum]